MKTLFIASLVFLSTTVLAQTKVIEVKSDKLIYSTTETPVLRATLFAKPDNSDFQFDIIAKLNGTEIKTDRVTDYEMFSNPKNLTVGVYTWVVTLVTQDARYARDLKTTIKYYENKNITIDQQLLTETNPTVIANLQAQKTQNLNIIAASKSELNNIRTPVLNPVSTTFTIQ